MSSQPVPTRTELARLRAEVAELQAELDVTRHEMHVLQSRRATRAGEALRQGRRTGAVKGALAAVGELGRGSVTPDKPDSVGDGPVLATRLRVARRLRDAGDLEQALDDARLIVLDHPEDPEALDLLVALQSAGGSLVMALNSAQRLARIDDSPRLRARRRRIAGTLRAFDERFAPQCGPLDPSARTGIVLVVVPDHSTETPTHLTSAGQAPVDDYLAALDPLVDHHTRTVREGLGAHYPRGGPLDTVLTDSATSLARAVSKLAPPAIVAVITDEDPGPAIVARAVATAAAIPLVVVRPGRGIGGSDLVMMSRAAGDRIAAAAEALVGSDDAITPAQAAQVTAELLIHIAASQVN